MRYPKKIDDSAYDSCDKTAAKTTCALSRVSVKKFLRPPYNISDNNL